MTLFCHAGPVKLGESRNSGGLPHLVKVSRCLLYYVKCKIFNAADCLVHYWLFLIIIISGKKNIVWVLIYGPYPSSIHLRLYQSPVVSTVPSLISRICVNISSSSIALSWNELGVPSLRRKCQRRNGGKLSLFLWLCIITWLVQARACKAAHLQWRCLTNVAGNSWIGCLSMQPPFNFSWVEVEWNHIIWCKQMIVLSDG